MERVINGNSTMKNIIIPLLAGTLLALPSVFGQPAQQRPTPGIIVQNPPPDEPSLAKFHLDFPGGTPGQLIEAIEKASGKSLNAVIPDDSANLKLPPLKMKSVTVPELFQALGAASLKQVRQVDRLGNTTLTTYQSAYGFRTEGRPTDNSIWYFYFEKPFFPEQPKACHFYQLAPYLETYKVDDITTAIQTGWKMLGETNPPTISFHKDTKLLIAVGEENKLSLIDSVLQKLAQGIPQPQRESTGAKTAEPAKK